jgi:hypothetical protein
MFCENNGGIRTRVFCSYGGFDDDYATPPVHKNKNGSVAKTCEERYH